MSDFEKENAVFIINGKSFTINTIVLRNLRKDVINSFAKSFKKGIIDIEQYYDIFFRDQSSRDNFHFFEICDLIYKTVDDEVPSMVDLTNLVQVLSRDMINAFALSFLKKFDEYYMWKDHDNGIHGTHNVDKYKTFNFIYILELMFQTVDDVLNEKL